MKLPKYQRQVSTSAETGAVRGDVVAAGAEWRAIGQIAQQVTGIATDVLSKINKEKTESQMADYSSKFDKDWAVAQSEMSKLPSKDQQAFYDGWKKQKEDELANSGYTKDAISSLSNANKYRFSKTDVGSMGIMQKTAVAESDIPYIGIQQQAIMGNGYTDPVTGDIYSPEQAYKYATEKRIGLGTVRAESGLEDIAQFGSKLERSRFLEESRTLEEMYLDGSIESDDYIKRLEEKRAEANKSTQLNSAHSAEVDARFDAQVLRYKRSEVKKTSDIIEKVRKDIDAGKFEVSDIGVLRRDAGDAVADNALAMMEKNARGLAVSDKDAMKGVLVYDRFLDGKISWPQALREASKLNDTSANVFSAMINSAAVEVSKGDKMKAYEFLKFDMPIKMDDFTRGVVKDIARAANMLDDGQSKYVNDKMSTLGDMAKFGDINDPEVQKKIRVRLFGSDAKEQVRASLKKQTKSVGGYEVGKIYSDASGNKARWNGEAWEEVE